MDYSVILHKADEGGYWVEVPVLPGCYSQGETVDEALVNIKEAIALYLSVLRNEGKAPPRDEELVFKVSVD